nr:S46 family peptidase [Bacteroidia bacterium]
SMKDAVVLFGGGCTGEIISEQGLLLTNHHCGFSQIQSHSSVEKDYLKNGFWAYSADEELACPGLSATFIIRIEDVTQKMLALLPAGIMEPERDLKIKELAATIEKEAVEGTHYTASIKPFYNGNQFYLFVMETFKDVRMVGAPPSSIGKFGGDTDNWMWPRHTGDFALFRIYAGADNKPAEYSKENKPFKPRHSFPVSVKGVQPGDFTMVYGFPGRTTQYIPSAAVSTTLEVANPARIKIRTERLRIIDAAMRSGDKLRIQYAAKQATIANAWKKWQGESKGLKRMKTIEVKKAEEAAFKEWVTDAGRTEYANLIADYESIYKLYRPLLKTNDYINEAAFGVELIRYARAYNKLALLCEANPVDEKAVKDEAARILSGAKGFFRDFDEGTDKQLFVSMMQMYMKDLDASMHPAYLKEQLAKNKNNWTAFANTLYAKSMLSDSIKVRTLLTGFTSSKSKKLLKDPAFMLAKSFATIYLDKIETEFVKLNTRINTLNRIYMAAQMEMKPTHMFYPDANSTLRVAYGNVSGYEPADGVTYDYFTTIEGIMEKEDASIEEFEVPQRLKELYKTKDYGAYGINGTLPVAFVASNHTTGGNSGSPVLNANGELIGTNFDRVWEGTMSDIDFDPDRCRNISLDIRFTLFVIDKYAGCSRLIQEMKIVN